MSRRGRDRTERPSTWASSSASAFRRIRSWLTRSRSTNIGTCSKAAEVGTRITMRQCARIFDPPRLLRSAQRPLTHWGVARGTTLNRPTQNRRTFRPICRALRRGYNCHQNMSLRRGSTLSVMWSASRRHCMVIRTLVHIGRESVMLMQGLLALSRFLIGRRVITTRRGKCCWLFMSTTSNSQVLEICFPWHGKDWVKG